MIWSEEDFEHYRSTGRPLKKRRLSSDVRAKISSSLKERKKSVEHRMNISESSFKRKV